MNFELGTSCKLAPAGEDNMYLFNNVDLEREYNMLGDIDLLEGINLEI